MYNFKKRSGLKRKTSITKPFISGIKVIMQTIVLNKINHSSESGALKLLYYKKQLFAIKSCHQ